MAQWVTAWYYGSAGNLEVQFILSVGRGDYFQSNDFSSLELINRELNTAPLFSCYYYFKNEFIYFPASDHFVWLIIFSSITSNVNVSITF